MAHKLSLYQSSSLLASATSRPCLSILRATLVSQTRSSSGVPRLTKLHRRQKAELRDERAESVLRAALLAAPTASPTSPTQPTEQPQATEESSTTLSTKTSNGLQLPYHVERTRSKQLPVYKSVKGGGTKFLTTIQKTSGDLTALKQDLADALVPLDRLGPRSGERGGYAMAAKRRAEQNAKTGQDVEQITINQTNGHIVIRGWRREEVKKFLTDRGF